SIALHLFLCFGNRSATNAAQSKQNASDAPTGTVQKMIVENGSVSMNLDLNRLNEISSSIDAGVSPADSSYLQPARLPLQAHFAVGANSFFPVLVFNELLRGPTPGTTVLILQSVPTFPGALGASFNRLVVEKLPSGQGFDLAVRDGNTGFTFFNIEGHQYDY